MILYVAPCITPRNWEMTTSSYSMKMSSFISLVFLLLQCRFGSCVDKFTYFRKVETSQMTSTCLHLVGPQQLWKSDVSCSRICSQLDECSYWQKKDNTCQFLQECNGASNNTHLIGSLMFHKYDMLQGETEIGKCVAWFFDISRPLVNHLCTVWTNILHVRERTAFLKATIAGFRNFVVDQIQIINNIRQEMSYNGHFNYVL